MKHRIAVVECERVLELKEGDEHERIELRLRERASRGLSVRLWLWDDRWCWFDARIGAKTGWAFEWTDQGRLAPGQTGRSLVEACECAFDKARAADADALAALWRPLLLRGPVAT